VLPRRDGLPLPVGGTIVHCRHVEGCFHEIGIRFSEELDPAALLPDAVGREDEIRDQTREMPALDGQILVVDPSQTDRNLMAHQLRTTGAALTMVDSTGAALEALNRRDFDAVVCDLGLDGERLRMMKRMRGAGYKGPIIVLTADNAAARLTQARAAGADEILGKPCDPQYLAAVLGERLEAAPVDRPIYSSLEDTPGMPDLIVDFIEQAQRAAQQIEKSLEAGELVGMREICLRLAGSGAGFGFGTVTGAARDAQTALDTAQDRNAMTAPLRRLAAICRRLRCANTVRPTRDQWAMAS
jgi:CheY-like chemotaxis protein